MKKLLKKGKKIISDHRIFGYLHRSMTAMGQKVVYSALLMFYAYKRGDTPAWAKNIIIGALAYVLSPFDAIPDLAPLFGFTDDLGVLSFGLVTIACYINEEVRSQSVDQIKKWFRSVDEKVLAEVDQSL